MQKNCLGASERRLAVIPARGGSKRIPRKNIKDFCGKPIIAYSIEAALGSGMFDEVMVSTDDSEIANVARELGGSVPFMRSAATSDDHATTADVLREVLESYKALGRSFDVVCCIYPTAPFVTASKIRDAFKGFDGDSSLAVCAVAEFGFPPLRGFVKRDGKMVYRFPECAKTRSQDLEPMYQDAGQFYIYGAGAISHGQIDPAGYIGYVVPQTETQDIDNLVDWELAELKYEKMMQLAGNGRD